HRGRGKRSRYPQCEALALGLRHSRIQGQIAAHQARRCNRGAEIFVSGGDPASPCIGTCVLDSANGYCRGCWRTLDEITGWPAASAKEKRRILSILEGRRLTAARMPSLLWRAAETLHVRGGSGEDESRRVPMDGALTRPRPVARLVRGMPAS